MRLVTSGAKSEIVCSLAAMLVVSAVVLAGAAAPSILNATSSDHVDASTPHKWSEAPSMLLPRSSPAVVILEDGNIFVIGGLAQDGPTSTTEMFNVSSREWEPGPRLLYARLGHTATLLDDGTVLVTGGETGEGATASAEIVNLTLGASVFAPSMYFARAAHSATKLANGHVLVTGGTDWSTGTRKEAETYDPVNHTWAPAGNMAAPRVFFSLHTLTDGRAVAVAGDSEGTSELYDPVTNKWSGTANMSSNRYNIGSVFLSDGRVLVAGGVYNGTTMNTCELYDPATNQWDAAANMTTPRAQFSLSQMPNGTVLAAGSWSGLGTTASSELFMPAEGAWKDAGSMNHSRGAHGAAALSNGMVFVIGGISSGKQTSSVEVYSVVPLEPDEKCMPIDLLPLVLAVAPELPGHSENGLAAKLYAAQAQYDAGEYAVCIDIMNAFYHQTKALWQSGHLGDAGASVLYVGYADVVSCMGGLPLSAIPF